MARKPTKQPAEAKKAKAAPKPRKGGRKPASKAAPAAAAPPLSSPSPDALASPSPSAAPAPTPRKVGRPSKYDPAMCETVIELGLLGKSRTQIARSLGTSRKTLIEWEGAHPEFGNAVSIAADYAQAWWEDVGQDNLMNKELNGHVYSFQMKNRFRHDYSEKIEVKHDATAAFSKIWQAVGTGKLEGTAP